MQKIFKILFIVLVFNVSNHVYSMYLVEAPGLKMSYACEGGYYKLVELLLDCGVDPNIEFKSEEVGESGVCTPLGEAVYCNQYDIVKLLFERGANPCLPCGNGKVPLDYARLKEDDGKMLELFKRNGVGINYSFLLYVACYNRDYEEIEYLLNKGGNPNLYRKNGLSLLAIACFSEQTDIVELLLDNGADPNLAGDNYFTPLAIARHYENIDIIELLLNKGANPYLSIDTGGWDFDIFVKQFDKLKRGDKSLFEY